MKTVSIQFQENSPIATVTVKNKTTQEIKKTDLPTVLNLISTLTSTDKDTGYLNSSLIREAVFKVSSRAFYLKAFPTEVKYTMRERIDSRFIKSDNPFGIKVRDGRLIFPDFIFRDVVGFISNSNTDGFNPSFYKVYNAIPDMLGNITDSTQLVHMFPNQFAGNICWPDSFDKKILSTRNLLTQSSFVTQYLTSIFNADLFQNTISMSDARAYEKDFNLFLKDVLHPDHQMTFESLSENYSGIFLFLFYYFISNVKNLNPTILTKKSVRTTLGSLFEQYK